MTLSFNYMEYGTKIVGKAFVFEEVGDVLPWHTHEFNDQHITIVAKGEFTMEVKGEEPCTIRAGDLIDTPPGVWHQFTALIKDSRFYNIYKEELIRRQ